MVLIIDTMNMIHSLIKDRNKEESLIQILSLLKQSKALHTFRSIFFMVDGYPFKLPNHDKKIHFSFSKDAEADDLIVLKAQKLASESTIILSQDAGIKNRLRDAKHIRFVGKDFFTGIGIQSDSKKAQSKALDIEELSKQSPSPWFESLMSIRFNEK